MRVVFCGVGALGSTAVHYCRNLGADLRLVDFDRVESKNLAAQWFVKQSVGKNKAEAARLQLANFYGVKAEAMGVRLAATNAAQLLAGCDLAVDAFDNQASRVLLSDAARAAGVALVHAALAADGTFGLVRWDERFVADREDVTGQATCEGGEHLPLIGVLGATLARAVQDFVRADARHDYLVSLSGVQRTT
ncbi:MAG: ThiF family adenylyltransferase [Kofleriaceae bacterium]|nr:ThiF family adenylyltransferase [Kofleriaceae bacterium]MCB9573094.1 ThiF family adenylyltransferase [Kofleriaceae bacterium]